eukprot:TRINITY_DN6038_c0_g1_i1.p1 TRINITY_DN6038_c0_g1~~TRINITY_DN6038_c0_g1_i1.p1  ORF type:complete len:545 (-),score=145.31 TRINITY_DN6038_c0_g1_i1:95-1729(-)
MQTTKPHEGGELLTSPSQLPSLFLNVADERLGAKVLWANDEWFAPAENLLKPGRGIARPSTFTERGQWMDGWETSRHGVLKRGGKDSAIIRLAVTAFLRGVDVDTNYFTGNHGEFASIDALFIPPNLLKNKTEEEILKSLEGWTEVLPKTQLNPGSQHLLTLPSSVCNQPFNFIRLNMFPDGGIARLKVYGVIIPSETSPSSDLVDLASAMNGGKVLSVSDNYFSSQDNLLLPGRGRDMGDGWETKRSRREDNNEWVVVKLGGGGVVREIEVDTNHFKGNYPNQMTIYGCYEEGGEWKELLPRVKLQGHHQHFFKGEEVKQAGVVTHIRVVIFPDGGVSRLRLLGRWMTKEEEEQENKKRKEKKNAVKAKPLVASQLYRFGSLCEFGGNDGKKIPFFPPPPPPPLSSHHSSSPSPSLSPSVAPPQMFVVRKESVKLPYTLEKMERQLSGPILFSPLSPPQNGGRYLVVCAPHNQLRDRPDLFNLNVSVAGPDQAVHLLPGIWYQIIPLAAGSSGGHPHLDFLVASSSEAQTASVESFGIEVDLE